MPTMKTAARLASALSARRRGGRRAWPILALLSLLAVASILLACSVGSVSLSVPELFAAISEMLLGTQSTLAVNVLELRLGRALSGFATGAALTLAGALLQALLRNPLADPYVLGVSGGAAVGALASLLFFSAFWIIDAAAFGGAILVALLLLALAHRDLRNGMVEGNVPILLLTGVNVASGCGSLVTLMLSIAPDNRLRGMVFWLIGDLSGAQLRWMPWLVLAAAFVFAVRAARSINLIALHAEAEATLGVRVGVRRNG
jgi:iron complex transport system permease protein